MKISIGSWCGVESGSYDSTGVQWTIAETTGWFDGPPSRTDFKDRPHYDGSFDAPEYAGARVVTFKGRIGVDDRAGLPALNRARQATQALLRRGMDTLRVVTSDEDLTARVRRSDVPTCDPVGGLAYDFEVQVTAPDPIRYAPTESTSGTFLTAQPPGGLDFSTGLDFGNGGLAFGDSPTQPTMYMLNPGTADVMPVFTFPTAVDQPVLVNPANGGWLEYRDSLVAGQSLVIDCKTKRVLLNGVSRRNRMARCDFDSFYVPAEGVLQVAFGSKVYPTDGARVQAKWYNGWW